MTTLREVLLAAALVATVIAAAPMDRRPVPCFPPLGGVFEIGGPCK